MAHAEPPVVRQLYWRYSVCIKVRLLLSSLTYTVFPLLILIKEAPLQKIKLGMSWNPVKCFISLTLANLYSLQCFLRLYLTYRGKILLLCIRLLLFWYILHTQSGSDVLICQVWSAFLGSLRFLYAAIPVSPILILIGGNFARVCCCIQVLAEPYKVFVRPTRRTFIFDNCGVLLAANAEHVKDLVFVLNFVTASFGRLWGFKVPIGSCFFVYGDRGCTGLPIYLLQRTDSRSFVVKISPLCTFPVALLSLSRQDGPLR